MRLFGLIGFPLSHSFSKKYFSEKFEKEGVADASYELFELPDIKGFEELTRQHPHLCGLNVTIPHKQAIIPYLDRLDASAEKVGAVNVVRFYEGEKIGYNSDYYGFKRSLQRWLPEDSHPLRALVLGTGGAAKAVTAALIDLAIPFSLISRKAAAGTLSYEQLQARPELLQQSRLLINTTPLGMSPHTDTAPPIAYDRLTSRHLLYDLVYNPPETRFMQLGKEKGAKVKNGLQMLQLQAEKAWEIWNEE